MEKSPNNHLRPPLPKVFVLELTRGCNHRCLYCYAVWGAASPAPQGGQVEMSSGEIKEIITNLQQETALEHIALSGGEPLLRPDLPEILSFLRERDITPLIITNGTLLTEERVAATMVGGNYEITLLSYRREVHDHLAGRRGAWDAAVAGMANVRQAEGNLVSVFVATKFNYMDLFKTAELAIALGAKVLMFNRINLGAHNLHLADQLLPTPGMIAENLDMLEELGEKYGLHIVITVVIEPCVVDIRKYKNIHFSWCPLAGENSYFTIDPSGNVRICNHSPVVLGNLHRDRFRDIYYHHPYVWKFRETWPRECSDCAPELKELCQGGCKAAAEQCYGTLDRVDPFVTLSQKRN
jgi:radical SAM protein with 4Fe4S-binding SPASM domain